VIGKKLRLFFIVWVWVLLSIGYNLYAEPPSSREYLVKGAFLYNFAKFVGWPEEALQDDPIHIILCVFGKDPFGGALASVKGKRVKDRKVVIKHCATLDELKKCHILFISRSEEQNLSEILAKVKNWNTLTVSDMEGFTQSGGVINFVTVEKKIRFEINLDAAERTGLKISSKLLRLAKIVKDKETGAEH
jgi:hypothetical protein